MAIIQEMRRKVYVRAFFVCPEDIGKFNRIRPDDGKPNGVLHELPKNNLKIGYGLQRSKESLLSGRNIRIPGTRANVGGKVLDLKNPVRRQQEAAHSRKIQPFVFGAFNHTVVEIEPINIDISIHIKAEAGTIVPASRPAPEGTGGVITFLV